MVGAYDIGVTGATMTGLDTPLSLDGVLDGAALWERFSQDAGFTRAESESGSAPAEARALVAAVSGAAFSDYADTCEEVGAALAREQGDLARRLDDLQRWSDIIASILDDALVADHAALLAAQQALRRASIEVARALTRGYERIHRQRDADEAEQARRGLGRLRALQSVNSVANSALHVDQTLSATARAVAEVLNADLCAIYLFDETTRELVLRATNGPSPRGGRYLTRKLGQGYTGWVGEHGTPLQVADALADQRFAEEASAYPTPYRGLLAMPIIFFTVERLQGVIAVQTEAPRVFAEEEVGFLEVVAGQIAMSVENSQLFAHTDQELRRKVHEMGTLHRVSAMVTSSLVLEQVLQMIVEQAVLLSGAERSALFVIEPASQRLHAVATHGFEDPEAQRATLPLGQCCAGRVAQSSEMSMRLDCMRTDGGCFLHDLPDAIGDQHLALCAPLVTTHGRLGALCVFGSQRYLLSQSQAQMVTTFANVAAIAIENARLYEETREGLRVKGALLREMHHRVKNNLQQVASILRMQRRRTAAAEAKQILLESIGRIDGIAATHDLLSNVELGRARMDDIVRKIVGIVQANLIPLDQQVQFEVGSIPIKLPSEQATTFAIVANELIANAIEHGFLRRAHGEIRISGEFLDEWIVFRVADDGSGLPDGFTVTDAGGMGLRLVRELVESELHGEVAMFRTPCPPDVTLADAPETDEALDGWTVAEIRFPLPVEPEDEARDEDGSDELAAEAPVTTLEAHS
jgi:two-component sensor histidine kinase